jgi:hypothetical protein
MSGTRVLSFTIARRRYEVRPGDVEEAVRGLLPEPVNSHFVVVNARQYPPKQVIGELTGLDRADFTSHQARRVLMNLGFAVGRRPARSKSSQGASDRQSGLADALQALVGQWVAVAGDEVIVAASSPREVVSWLASHHKTADSMFRVPEDEVAASGLAPL